MSRLLRFAVTIVVISACTLCLAQPKLTPQNSGTTNRLQAISPVNASVVWASGVAGTYTRTTDGGKTWHPGVVPGAETLQFRDVEAVSDKVAYLMAAGSGTDSRIYKTENGGKTWTLQFTNQDPNAFYDCFSFWTPWRGITFSDSVNGRFPVIRTRNGKTWKDIGDRLPTAQAGEAGFAASGTCVATVGLLDAWIGTGGAEHARVLATHDGGQSWNAYNTPLETQGTPASGIFSVAFRDQYHGFIAGGDLDSAAPLLSDKTATSRDGGRNWKLTSQVPVPGAIYGSSYAQGRDDDNLSFFLGFGLWFFHDRDDDRTVVVTGPGGAAYSYNEGDNWKLLPADVNGYWAVAFANHHTGWFVGTNGRILKITFDDHK